MTDSTGPGSAAERAVARFAPGSSWARRRFSWFAHRSFVTVMRGLNTTEIVGQERFDAARSMASNGLLTFSNHVSLFDDPLVTARLTGPSYDALRWVAADAINFFGTPFKARFFSIGRAVPIIRGGGIDQVGMGFLSDRLRAGDWVHFFPEGGRTRDPEGRLRLPFKVGMAHLVRAARPTLLAFHHVGMRDILPVGARVPASGQHVTVRVGEACDSALGLADTDIAAITRWAEEQLLALEALACGPRPAGA